MVVVSQESHRSSDRPMSDPKVSVVLPVRNGVPYLRKAVQSVLAQTFADLELVVLENWSSDGTAEILAGFDDPRLRVVPAERPLSIIENWARAAEQTRGSGRHSSGTTTSSIQASWRR